MGRSLLVGFVFFAIFVAGGIAGGFMALRYVRHQPGQNNNNRQPPIAVPFNPQVMRRFAEQLDLTHEQKEKIRQIIIQYADEIRVLRHEIDTSNERMQEDVDKILTLDQRVKLQQLKEDERGRLLEQNERVRRFLLEHGHHGEPPNQLQNAAPAQNQPPAQKSAPPASQPSSSSSSSGAAPAEAVSSQPAAQPAH